VEEVEVGDEEDVEVEEVEEVEEVQVEDVEDVEVEDVEDLEEMDGGDSRKQVLTTTLRTDLMARTRIPPLRSTANKKLLSLLK
jgi:hypothetical protein